MTKPPLLPERDVAARASLVRTLTPHAIRSMARLVFLFFLVLPFGLAFIPW